MFHTGCVLYSLVFYNQMVDTFVMIRTSVRIV